MYSKLDTKKFDEEYDLVIDYVEYINLIESPNKKELCELTNIIVVGKNLYKNFFTVIDVQETNELFSSKRNSNVSKEKMKILRKRSDNDEKNNY